MEKRGRKERYVVGFRIYYGKDARGRREGERGWWEGSDADMMKIKGRR